MFKNLGGRFSSLRSFDFVHFRFVKFSAPELFWAPYLCRKRGRVKCVGGSWFAACSDARSHKCHGQASLCSGLLFLTLAVRGFV